MQLALQPPPHLLYQKISQLNYLGVSMHRCSHDCQNGWFHKILLPQLMFEPVAIAEMVAVYLAPSSFFSVGISEFTTIAKIKQDQQSHTSATWLIHNKMENIMVHCTFLLISPQTFLYHHDIINLSSFPNKKNTDAGSLEMSWVIQLQYLQNLYKTL